MSMITERELDRHTRVRAYTRTKCAEVTVERRAALSEPYFVIDSIHTLETLDAVNAQIDAFSERYSTVDSVDHTKYDYSIEERFLDHGATPRVPCYTLWLDVTTKCGFHVKFVATTCFINETDLDPFLDALGFTEDGDDAQTDIEIGILPANNYLSLLLYADYDDDDTAYLLKSNAPIPPDKLDAVLTAMELE